MKSEPEIVELQASDASELRQLLLSEREAYLRYAPRFRTDADALATAMVQSEADRWWGFRIDGELVGFFMLRGFDEGYARPSFGVFVAESAAGKGLGRIALAHALAWCSQREVGTVMLKVDAENQRAYDIYSRAGFREIGVCPDSGQRMMEKKIAAE